MRETPFKKSWWVVEGRLLAGCYPGDMDEAEAARKLSNLLDAGIRAVVCLQEEDERDFGGRPFAPYRNALEQMARDRGFEVHWRRFPIRDYSVPDVGAMKSILDEIDVFLDANLPVYVHCWGGHGRTGTVVGCWLVRKGMTGQQALEELFRLRRCHSELHGWSCPQSSDQISMVQHWRVGQ